MKNSDEIIILIEDHRKVCWIQPESVGEKKYSPELHSFTLSFNLPITPHRQKILGFIETEATLIKDITYIGLN